MALQKKTVFHFPFLNSKSLTLVRVLSGFAVVLGLIFLFLVPPFQKPDETTHFYKTIAVARGSLVCSEEHGVFQNLIPKYLNDFPTKMFALHIASNTMHSFPRGLYTSTLFQKSFDTSLVNEPSSCSLPFLLYIPAAIVLAVPVLSHANPLVIFYLGRLTNFGVSLLFFWLAYRVAPKKTKLLPLFILSLPIVLYQLSSFSKDALHISSGVLAFSVLLSMMEKKRVSLKEIFLFLMLNAVVVLSRPQYILFLFLACLVPFEKMKQGANKAKLFTFFCMVSLAAIIVLSLSKGIYSAKAESLGQDHPNVFVYPSQQLQFLMEKPLAFIGVMGNTLEENSYFYFRSAVDILGWLEYRLPWFIPFMYLGFGAYIFLQLRKDLPRLSVLQAVVLASVCAGSFIGILLSFYLYATPVGAAVVLAPLGRYFLVLLPYFLWLVGNLMNAGQKTFIVGFFSVIVVSAIGTVSYRYYFGEKHFYRDVPSYPAVDRSLSTFVDQEYQETIPIREGKKLVGFGMFAFKRDQIVSKPYELQVLDPSCTKILTTKVIDASHIGYDEWNDVTFSPIVGYTNVCLKIHPYLIGVPQAESLQLAQREKNKLWAIPLYVY